MKRGRGSLDVVFPPVKKQHSGIRLLLAVGVVLALSIFDFIADISIVVKFSQDGDVLFAMAVLTPVLVSVICQAIVGYSWEKKWYVCCFALFGLFLRTPLTKRSRLLLKSKNRGKSP